MFTETLFTQRNQCICSFDPDYIMLADCNIRRQQTNVTIGLFHIKYQ